MCCCLSTVSVWHDEPKMMLKMVMVYLLLQLGEGERTWGFGKFAPRPEKEGEGGCAGEK